MDKAELERITDGLAQGDGEATLTDANGNERSYNVVGAVNEMLTVLEDMDKYGLTASDLDEDQLQSLDMGQQALQYHQAKIGRLMQSITENDGTVTFSDGSTVQLPNSSTTSDTDGLPESLTGDISL